MSRRALGPTDSDPPCHGMLVGRARPGYRSPLATRQSPIVILNSGSMWGATDRNCPRCNAQQGDAENRHRCLQRPSEVHAVALGRMKPGWRWSGCYSATGFDTRLLSMPVVLERNHALLHTLSTAVARDFSKENWFRPSSRAFWPIGLDRFKVSHRWSPFSTLLSHTLLLYSMFTPPYVWQGSRTLTPDKGAKDEEHSAHSPLLT
jgi:hypothetical protein